MKGRVLIMNVIVSLLLCVVLAGCNSVKLIETPAPEITPSPSIVTSIERNGDKFGFNGFDDNLISYLNDSDFSEENYVISPLSIKLAMALLAEGAANETQEEILKGLDVSSINDLRKISKSMNELSELVEAMGEDDLNMYKKYPDAFDNKPDVGVFSVNNSIWKNGERVGNLKVSYINTLSEYYNAVSQNVKKDELEIRINSWTNEKTNGLIKKIVNENVKDMNTILVNTVYLKDSWLKPFEEYNTIEDDFTDINGNRIKKDFMYTEEKLAYYEDNTCQIVSFPTNCGFEVIYVLGDNSNIEEKLLNMKYEEVHLKVPKMDIDSSFESDFMNDFFVNIGVGRIFTPLSDFSNMIENLNGSDYFVDSILHKAKLTTDEDGIEAAAVTAILMMDNAAMIPEEPKFKEFIANKPYTFYVLHGSEDVHTGAVTDAVKEQNEVVNKNLIFYGQYVK